MIYVRCCFRRRVLPLAKGEREGRQVRSTPCHRVSSFGRAFCPGIVCDKTTVITVYKKGRLLVLHFIAEGGEIFFFPIVQDTVVLVFAVRLAT